MVQNAIVVDKKENVATALHRLDAGSSVCVEVEGHAVDIMLPQAIPLGHKFALKDIETGEPVIKYGEIIGLATQTKVARPTRAS